MDLKLVFASVLVVASVCHTMASTLSKYEVEQETKRTLEEGILKQLLNLQSRSKEHEKKADPEFYVSNGCYRWRDGSDYRGSVSTTETGKTCQKWTTQSPHGHSRTPDNYRDSGLGDHNYCRNPDGEPRTWCYTTNGDARWEYCDIGEAKCSCLKDNGEEVRNPGCMMAAMGR